MSEGEVSKTMEVMRSNVERNLKDVFAAIQANNDNCTVNDIDQLSYDLNINKNIAKRKDDRYSKSRKCNPSIWW